MPTDRSSILYLSCSKCGLLNIPERRTCKRCQTTLDSAAQVRVPAPPSQRATAPPGCILVWLAFLGSMFILFVIRVINPPPPTVPQPGGIIDIRGNRLAVLRMVTAQPFEGIEVFDDGTAIRFYYPEGPPHDYSQITLTPDEQAAFVQFRMEWCQHMPSFRALGASEPFYDLGVQCGGNVKQAKVPHEQLPAIFTQLQHRLPRPKV